MTKRVKLSLLWILPMVLGADYAFAYGAAAHRVVGYIADDAICASTQVTVSAMLDGESLAEAGLWADQIRGTAAWDYAKPWHYINVPDDAPPRVGSAAKPDILWAINEMLQRLQDPELTAAEQSVALRFLIHLVADIHQPLHVGRKADRGGNRIKVSFNSAGRAKPEQSNLHRYWDSDVIRISTTAARSYAAKLQRQEVPKLRNAALGQPLDWAEEAQALRVKVYDFQPVSADEAVFLGAGYRDQALSIINVRLTLAGLRLAAVLDSLYAVPNESCKPGN